MATTPRPYIWKAAQLISSSADGTGATFHFYDTKAQMIYPNSGLQYKAGSVPEGHWEDLSLGNEIELEDVNYEILKSDHPATGSLYMVGLRRTTNHDTLYLFRYDYLRDISELVENATLTMQVDNPITQISANIKNIKDSLFTIESSLFTPSSKLWLGIAYGGAAVTSLAIGYTDEINWRYGAKTVSLSGRNTVGYYLKDQTFDEKIVYNDTAINVLEAIFARFGITDYYIDPLGTSNVEIEVAPTDTALKAIQTISDLLSDAETTGAQWDIEEMYDGHIVVGFDAFRGTYIPRGHYTFDGKNDVFAQSIDRSTDGAYAQVRCTGTDANKNELTPAVASVTNWRYWSVSPHKTYHAPKVEGTTQAELNAYAKSLARQLKYVGRKIHYKAPLRPQLVIGDVAEVTNGIEMGEEANMLGTITEIRHNFGERGYFTEFTLDSGGDATTVGTAVYSTGKANKGNNRKKRISDFIS